MTRTAAETEALVAAWVRYWDWFNRDGLKALQAWQADLRARGVSVFEAMVSSPPPKSPDATEWASEAVQESMSRGDADDGWDLLTALVRSVPEELLGHVGAGPFDQWVSEERAQTFFERIAQAAAADPRWKTVLAASWKRPGRLAELL